MQVIDLTRFNAGAMRVAYGIRQICPADIQIELGIPIPVQQQMLNNQVAPNDDQLKRFSDFLQLPESFFGQRFPTGGNIFIEFNEDADIDETYKQWCPDCRDIVKHEYIGSYRAYGQRFYVTKCLRCWRKSPRTYSHQQWLDEEFDGGYDY